MQSGSGKKYAHGGRPGQNRSELERKKAGLSEDSEILLASDHYPLKSDPEIIDVTVQELYAKHDRKR